MQPNLGSYLHVLGRNLLPDGTQILHINELPPPYSCLASSIRQTVDSDWCEEIVEVKPLSDDSNRYGFVVGGGTDTESGPAIVVTHIEHCSNSSSNNGRTNLRLFDRIYSVNGIDLTRVTHNEAARVFSSTKGQILTLHIRRLNPSTIEHIEVTMPSDTYSQSLGFTIHGGRDTNDDDPGLFISRIDSDSLVREHVKNGQIHVGDRLLEIRTNYTSANLQWVTHDMGVRLIRRICQDNPRITLIIARRNNLLSEK